ncbi:RNAse P Rpr2 Rpp21 subunit domain protein [Fusarium sp. NRRL 52700]|nr:RNAse P Rpr2 Rpp21 subunit domain protein [Fusarium sp. NRRL 52700]
MWNEERCWEPGYSFQGWLERVFVEAEKGGARGRREQARSLLAKEARAKINHVTCRETVLGISMHCCSTQEPQVLLIAPMAKGKESKGVQNRIIYSRASYLYQAASYLTKQSSTGQDAAAISPNPSHGHSVFSQTRNEEKALKNMSRQAISDLRAVTLKAQIRRSRAMKQTICKFCDTLLVEGDTCTSTVENASKGGRKPWADILNIACKTCGNVKRYPVCAPRQKRKHMRKHDYKEGTEQSSNESNVQGPTAQTETPISTPRQTPGP